MRKKKWKKKVWGGDLEKKVKGAPSEKPEVGLASRKGGTKKKQKEKRVSKGRDKCLKGSFVGSKWESTGASRPGKKIP